MSQPNPLDDLLRRFGDALPGGVRQMQNDIEKNVRAGLQSTFNRLDLVTREEFDVQQAVLMRTRARLEQLEQRVAELEARLAAKT